jgi:beta-lactamase superfamily II metal-dependent hydrolase
MLDIDFISRSDKGAATSSSYDAIALRFKEDQDESQKVVVIDGGFSETGTDLLDFIQDRYQADKIDLMISTHPDTDHLNGLVSIIQQMPVSELLIHQPRLYRADLDDFKNIDNLDDLLAYATEMGTTITNAYAGISRLQGRIRILGPTQDFYTEQLNAQLDPTARIVHQLRSSLTEASVAMKDFAGRALGTMPEETLGNSGITSPRNESSAITLLQVSGNRYLFTADAGREALSQAVNEYENTIGNFTQFPINLFQAPHHGSRRNLGETILDRIFGSPESPFSYSHVVFIHAAAASKKHPSPKVTNALMRRGCKDVNLGVTNGINLWHSINSEPRNDYFNMGPYPILPEE